MAPVAFRSPLPLAQRVAAASSRGARITPENLLRSSPICRNNTAMQISKFFLIVCAVVLCVAPLTIRAAESETQTQPPAAKPEETTASKAEAKKQADAEAKARKEAEKKAKAEAKANREAEKAEQAIIKKHAEAEAKARKEAEKKAQAEEAPKAESQKPPAEQSQAQPKSGKKAPALTPIEPAPLPISADKQQRLADLLRQYKADQLSPEQYHQARTKILAEP